MQKKLNIVDEKGNIIGKDTRENIHKQGLLHKEVHVWFHTSKGEIIFQHRAEDKDTYPNLLDASVGGHVEIGENYEESAVKEVEEETGLNIKDIDITLITTTITKNFDPVTETTNHAMRKTFTYRYTGSINDLKVEDGKGLGFEIWLIDDILNISAKDKTKFIPSIFGKEILDIFRKIKESI